MLASDAQNPEFAGAHNPDSRLSVRFYSRPVQNMVETQKQGRPIFEDRDYVQIFLPGDSLNCPDKPVTDEHIARFPLHWAHYKNTRGDSREIGTPLSQWPLLTASQVEELKAIKFYTVESIAGASDAQIANIGMCGGMNPMSFRSRAQAFLQAAQNSALPQQQAEEIEKLRQENRQKDEAHAAELADLRKTVEALAANQKGKPGRKVKEAEAA